MILLKAIRTRCFYNDPLTLLISSNSSKFTNISSIPHRPFSRSSQSSPAADEKIRSFIAPVSGFFRRVIFGEERTDESNRPAAENAERISEETSVGEGLRNLGEQIRDLRRETVGNAEPSSEKIGTIIAAKMEKGRSDSKVAPRKEKRVLSALFRDSSSGRRATVGNIESSSAKTGRIIAPKLELGQSDSKVEPKEKLILSALLKGDKKGKSKSKTTPAYAKTDPIIAPKLELGQSDSKVEPRKEKLILSALLKVDKKGQPKSKTTPAYAKTDPIIAPKLEKGHSDSEVAPRKEKRVLSVLLKGDKRGHSKSKLKSKTKAVERTAYGVEDRTIRRELSSDMKMFAEHLYAKGYLKNATFMPQDRFDPTSFEVSYAREFLRFAAVKFGENHPDVARLLSDGDLRTVVHFGCPSLAQRTVYAAKNMRSFFEIEELKVCQACTLKKLCKHRNKSTTTKHSSKFNLGNVMKVLIMYAMESVPQKLVVPEDVRDSVSRLLKEITSLSQETPMAQETV